MNNPNQPTPDRLTSALVLSTGRDESTLALPLALEGFPTQITVKVGAEHKTFPVSYFQKDTLETGDFKHSVTGQEFAVTPERMDMWVDKFRAMRAEGVEIHCPADHSDRAEDNRGFALKMARDGTKLKCTSQIFGEDGALLALRNRCSVKITPDFIDEKGKHWGEAIEHIAFTPIPVISGQGPFVPFAASRGEATGTPILYLSASKGIPEMELTKLRAAIDAAKEISDEKVIELAVAKLTEGKTALELSRTDKTKAEIDLAALKTRAEKAESDLATSNAKVLELSRAPDPGILADRADLMAQKIDLALDKGQCVKAQADILKAALKEGDKPNALMLSRSGASGTPIDLCLKVLELNKALTGTKTGDQRLPDPNATGDAKPVTPERKKELLAHAGMTA